jgi:hypothetical protein
VNPKTFFKMMMIIMIVTLTMAVPYRSFDGWGRVMRTSPAIIVARCTETPTETGIHGVIDANIEVLSVLKGTNQLGKARLVSLYRPRQNETYLILPQTSDSSAPYQAIESYRIVSLGVGFSTNQIWGTSLDEQLQSLFQRRLRQLNLELKEGQEEVKRLEAALK